MDDAVNILAAINEWTWKRFREDLREVTAEEVDWRPVPQANSINIIVRHLSIEAQWHLASLTRGEPMPAEVTPELQQAIDSVPVDFEQNLKQLEDALTGFVAAMREMTLPALQQQTERTYETFAMGRGIPPNFLGFHQMSHLTSHWGQIRMIRNLYRTMRGEPARFFPENPTFPSTAAG